MLIDQISIPSLRVFERVYSVKNMSKAATELFMTQPGVSQHIQNLESALGEKLFDRINKQIIPTPFAKELYETITPLLFELEEKLRQLTDTKTTLKGKISIGLPIEFGNNVILPIIASWSKEYRHVSFEIKYGHAAQFQDDLNNGILDFAIVDSFNFGPRILTENISREHLVLCASGEYLKTKNLKKKLAYTTLLDLDFVDYIEGAPILKQWFQHHYDGKTPKFNLKAHLMDVQGMAQVILSGLGAGVLPMHMVKKLLDQGKDIEVIKGPGTPLFNEINMAYLGGKTMGLAASNFTKFLLESLQKRVIYLS